jgi:hypothetical protein
LAAARLEEGTRGVNLAAGWAVEEMAVGLGLAAPLVEVASSHQVVPGEAALRAEEQAAASTVEAAMVSVD